MMTSLEIYKHASFFKILLFDFSSKLRIPKEFVKKYGEILPQEAILETESGAKTWNVNIKPLDDRFCFTNGWPEFVKDYKLSEMDFVVFNLVSKSTFQVAIYGKEGILKQPPSSPYCPKCEGKLGGGLQSERDEEMSEDKSFTSVIKKDGTYSMAIPRGFAMETGIARRNAINLLNEDGKKWGVKVYKERNGERFSMTKGWSVVRKQNKLSVGDKLRFEFHANSGNLILKKEIETATNVIIPANRKRGWPRKTVTVPAKRLRGMPRKLAEGLQSESDEEEELSESKSFTGVIKKDSKYCMAIPKAFAVETGIARRNAIQLQNEGGKKWGVKIYDGFNGFHMTKGWRAFGRENKLYVGTKFSFEFHANSGNLILKKETQTPKNLMSSGKRGRGRPRKNTPNC